MQTNRSAIFQRRMLAVTTMEDVLSYVCLLAKTYGNVAVRRATSWRVTRSRAQVHIIHGAKMI